MVIVACGPSVAAGAAAPPWGLAAAAGPAVGAPGAPPGAGEGALHPTAIAASRVRPIAARTDRRPRDVSRVPTPIQRLPSPAQSKCLVARGCPTGRARRKLSGTGRAEASPAQEGQA